MTDQGPPFMVTKEHADQLVEAQKQHHQRIENQAKEHFESVQLAHRDQQECETRAYINHLQEANARSAKSHARALLLSSTQTLAIVGFLAFLVYTLKGY